MKSLEMKRTVFVAVILIVTIFVSSAQDATSVRRYYESKIDSLAIGIRHVDAFQTEDGRENSVYYRMFVPPILYKSTLRRGLADGFETSDTVSNRRQLDESRGALIDKMLLNLYACHPQLISQTEDQLRNEFSISDVRQSDVGLAINVNETPAPLPQDITESVATTYVKPNFWRTSGEFSLNFTQNYVSGNWHQGGENNKTMLGLLKFIVRYNDKNKITFESVFEAKLGFTTVEADTLHSIKTNNDMLRLESKLGYKIAKNLDATINLKMSTQAMPSYPTNSRDFVSNFMAPFDATFSLGVDYKRSGKNWNMSLYFAPLSSYNYKFVRYSHLATRFGIREGRQHKEDFGTQVVLKPNATIFENLSWSSRMEFYTNYSRAFFEWENTFSMKLNKYFNVQLFLHSRFDDSAPGLYCEDYGYWQLKEYMTLGLTYSW